MWVDAWVRARDGRPVWIRGLDSGLGLGRRERTVAILGAAVIADLIEEEDVVSQALDEQLAEALVRHFGWVEDNLHGLCVASFA